MNVRNSRTNSYWEPVFGFGKEHPYKPHYWDLNKGETVIGFTFRRPTNESSGEFSHTKIIDEVTFDCCDFDRDFGDTEIVFKKCTFRYVDFGKSIFRKAKFTNCTFYFTSFSQVTFWDCELRSCNFESIGVSGNATRIEKTLISNPKAFIEGMTTNISSLPPYVSEKYQIARLLRTKATISRAILASMTYEGSNTEYYEAIKVSTEFVAWEKISNGRLALIDAKTSKEPKKLRRNWLSAKGFLRLAVGYCELYALRFFGLLNDWGASIFRPTLLGAFTIFSFALCYWSRSNPDTFLNALMKSIEVFFLFGYTKHSVTDHYSASVLFNAVLGLLWYIVAVPTVIDKTTRMRS